MLDQRVLLDYLGVSEGDELLAPVGDSGCGFVAFGLACLLFLLYDLLEFSVQISYGYQRDLGVLVIHELCLSGHAHVLHREVPLLVDVSVVVLGYHRRWLVVVLASNCCSRHSGLIQLAWQHRHFNRRLGRVWAATNSVFKLVENVLVTLFYAALAAAEVAEVIAG